MMAPTAVPAKTPNTVLELLFIVVILGLLINVLFQRWYYPNYRIDAKKQNVDAFYSGALPYFFWSLFRESAPKGRVESERIESRLWAALSRSAFEEPAHSLCFSMPFSRVSSMASDFRSSGSSLWTLRQETKWANKRERARGTNFFMMVSFLSPCLKVRYAALSH